MSALFVDTDLLPVSRQIEWQSEVYLSAAANSAAGRGMPDWKIRAMADTLRHVLEQHLADGVSFDDALSRTLRIL